MHPSHQSIGDLLDILPDAVIMVDARSRISFVNPAVRALLGYAPSEILGQPLSALIPPDSRERHEIMVADFRRGGAPKMMGTRPVLHALDRSGQVVPVSISLCNLTLGDTELVSVAVIHDVSALHTDLDRATALAESDPLTGLGNRLRLSRKIQALLQGTRPFSLLYLDLKNFKPLNDRHGHDVGDRALCIVGQRLMGQVRGADIVARVGGDEFVMLFDGMDDPHLLQSRAASVVHSLTQPMHMDTVTDALGVNAGGAIRPRHGRSESTLLSAADRAMYAAKQAGESYRMAQDDG